MYPRIEPIERFGQESCHARGKERRPWPEPAAFFRSELRHYRKQAGLTQGQLGERLNFSDDQVSKVETGEQAPSPEFTKACDAEFGTGGALERMLAMVRTQSFPGWYRPFVEYEREARTLRVWEPLVVSGLLQTEEYARAVLRAGQPTATDEEVEEQVAARMQRQAILERDDPPLLYVLLDEATLYRGIGGAKTMAAQLDHLMELARNPKITIQVVPSSVGAHAGLAGGAFTIATLNGGDTIIYLDAVTKGPILDRTDDVEFVTSIYDALRAEALPRGLSLDLIQKAKESWT